MPVNNVLAAATPVSTPSMTLNAAGQFAVDFANDLAGGISPAEQQQLLTDFSKMTDDERDAQIDSLKALCATSAGSLLPGLKDLLKACQVADFYLNLKA